MPGWQIGYASACRAEKRGSTPFPGFLLMVIRPLGMIMIKDLDQNSSTANLIKIRLSKRSDLRKYSSLLQESIQKAYTDAKLGYTKNLFSDKVFSSEGMQDWMKSNLYPGPKKKTWLAFLKSRLVGAITVTDKGSREEFRAFYVATDLQSMGIGRRLFQRALEYSKGKDVLLVMYPHNLKTLKIYRRWGFKKYGKSGYHHWSAWPQSTKMKYWYMLLTKSNVVKLHRHLINR